jgi:hypothetical protein
MRARILIRLSAIAAFLLCAQGARAQIANVYLAQTAAGSGSGADCADAKAYTFFNTASNWGTGAGQIGPGTIVHLCGTFSFTAGTSGALNAQGSGSSGNVIRIQFETGASASAPYWGSSGFLNISGQSFIQIDGSPSSTPCGFVNNVDVACNGTIAATANGAALANHVANGHGVNLSNAHDIEVRNLFCSNLFVPVQNNTLNEGVNGINNTTCVWFLGSSNSNINAHNLEITNSLNGVLLAFEGTSTNFHADNMWVQNVNNCGQIGAGSPSSTLTASTFNGNDCSNMAPWDRSDDANHHEFLHLYTTQSGGSSITGFTFAGNYLHGTLGAFMTALAYIECDGGCSSPGGITITEYNNRFVNTDPNADISTGAGGNGINECEGATCGIYNNTCYSDAHYSTLNFCQHTEGGGVVTARGNIYDGANAAFVNGGGTINATTNLGFGLATACGAPCTVTTDPLLSLSSAPPYELQAGSSAIGAGPNLTSLGISGLDMDANGVARPASGGWDMGAFQFAGGTVTLTPASNNFASVNVGLPSSATTFTLSNGTASTITGIVVSFTGTNASDFTRSGGTCSTTLVASGTCTILVVFTPGATGVRTGTLNVANSSALQTSALSGTGVAPAVTFAPTSVTFGNENVGSTSAARAVTLTNSGTATLTISSITLTGTNPGDFAQTNNCGTSVLASGSCTINVTFSPTAAGAQSANISVADNAAGSPQTVPLTGTGVTATAGISFSPTSIAFAARTVGTSSAPTAVTVTNTGSATLTITTIAISGGNTTSFSQTNNCTSVAPAGTCTINVTFTPQVAGALSSSVRVTDNAAGSPQSVPLSGTGNGVAAISFTPTSLAFGNEAVGSTTAALSTTAKNTGTATLTLSSITLTGANAGDFAISANTCGGSLAIAATCMVSVTFTPSATGARAAALSFADNAAGSPQTVALTGTGTQAGTNFSPPSLSFGSQAVSTTSAPLTTTLTNSGSATLTISSITITGANAADFAISAKTCGATLAASGTCTVSVTFTPSATGARAASLSFTDNAPGIPQTVPLTGTGTSSDASAAPSSLTFAATIVGHSSAAQTVTLTNTGSLTITISSIAISGANAGDFSRTTTCGATLAVSASCTAGVTFTPTATGARTASLVFTDSGANSTQSVSLQGTGTQAGALVAPTSINFGSEPVGSTSAGFNVTLTNNGTATLTISSILLGGTDPSYFAISANTCGGTLAAAAVCTVSLTFTPQTAIAAAATLSFTDSGPASPQVVTLSGLGTFTAFSFNPTSVAFANQATGTNSAPRSITVLNSGNGTAAISSITIGGTNIVPNVFFGMSAFSTAYPFGGIQLGTLGKTGGQYGYYIQPTCDGGGNPASSCYVWDKMDAWVATAQANGQTLVYDFDAMPLWMCPPQATTPYGPRCIGSTPINYTALGNLATAIATRYKGKIQYYETYNEMNLNAQEWSGTCTNLVLWHNTIYNAIKAVDSAAFVGAPNVASGHLGLTGSCTQSPTTGGDVDEWIFVQNFLATTDPGGHLPAVDAIGHHAYGNTAVFSPGSPILDTVAQYTLTIYNNFRAVATAQGIPTSRSILVTEGSWGIDNPNPNCGSPLNTTGCLTNQGQIAYVGRLLALMASTWSDGGGSLMSWYAFDAAYGTLNGTSGMNAQNAAAYGQMESWIAGSSWGAQCTAGTPSTIMLCPFTAASGDQEEIVFNNNNGTASSFTTPGWATTYQQLLGTATTITGGTIMVNDTPILLTGAPATFSQTNNCGVGLSGGGSCTVNVIFTPPSAGSFTGSVVFTDSAPGSPQSVPLSGTGFTPTAGISLNPASLTFGGQIIGTASNAQVVIATNTGTATVTISSITVTGANPGDFGVSNTCAGSIAVGSACTISVTFTPTAAGSRSASVSIADNVPGSPQTIALTGTGLAGPVIIPDPAMFSQVRP